MTSITSLTTQGRYTRDINEIINYAVPFTNQRLLHCPRVRSFHYGFKHCCSCYVILVSSIVGVGIITKTVNRQLQQ
jgi:hypothetical protein